MPQAKLIETDLGSLDAWLHLTSSDFLYHGKKRKRRKKKKRSEEMLNLQVVLPAWKTRFWIPSVSPDKPLKSTPHLCKRCLYVGDIL